MPVLYVHCGSVLNMARQARDRAKAAVAANPDDWPVDATAAIILAAAATEAFINEVAEAIDHERQSAGSSPPGPALCAFADAIQETESAKGNTQLKYLVASVMLTGKPFDKGAQPYQDFATLIRLRNDIMHLKPSDTLVMPPTPGQLPSIEIPKYIVGLQQRGLARTPPTTSFGMSWFNVIQTDKMAEWSCDSAAAIMKTVVSWVIEKADQQSTLRMMFTKVPA